MWGIWEEKGKSNKKLFLYFVEQINCDFIVCNIYVVYIAGIHSLSELEVCWNFNKNLFMNKKKKICVIFSF